VLDLPPTESLSAIGRLMLAAARELVDGGLPAAKPEAADAAAETSAVQVLEHAVGDVDRRPG
jgi:hypothetical protein